MFRILIADDEKDERSVIRFLLNKFQFELDIIEAANGKEAVQLLEKDSIDILFTDVKMPFVNGIDLAAKAKALNKDIQIIFFSGHDDFNFIKKALSLRAVNYILKPVSPNELKQTMASVIENMEQRSLELKQKETNITFLKSHILYRLLNGTSIDALINEYPFINMDYLKEYYRMILIQFEEPFFDKLLKEETSLFFAQLKQCMQGNSFDYLHLNPDQLLLLFTEKLEQKNIKELARKIHQEILLSFNIIGYISISEEIALPEKIPARFKQMENYLEDRFFYKENYIYPIDSNKLGSNDYLEQDEDLLQAIQRAIQYVDTFSFNKNIDTLFHKYNKKNQLSHIYVRFLFSRLFQILCHELPQYKESILNEKISAIYSCTHFSEIEKIVEEVKLNILTRLEEKEQSSKHVIPIVKQYINEHYPEDLSLNLLADKVYLSPRYLSEVFIQETGSGINKYIKQIRMDSAKNLLVHTNMKINDICKQVGYQNFSYFVRSFRENFGLSPEKFRQSHRDAKEKNEK
ncbi:HTH-type transcriptional activator RhaR [Bacillus sp. T2.9-1]|uniref:response regulator transcription factor n=1 Tax=Bacillus sp. T2.9-1 TaxID=3041163 RepID=UPI002477CBC5|nr:response regulator [Bacillus sp. T2.9-1]CAI9393744.1 HTH-type transcriptional activator RhaR [Bacillus sp. T2.9-1]